MKRQRIRPVSEKAASVAAETRRRRAEWRDAQPNVCMVCGFVTEGNWVRGWLDLHHLAGKDKRSLRYERPENYLLACSAFAKGCHEKCHADSQLAWHAKKTYDPANADLEVLRGLASKFNRVTE